MNRVWTGPKHVTFDNFGITTGFTFQSIAIFAIVHATFHEKKKQDTVFLWGT